MIFARPVPRGRAAWREQGRSIAAVALACTLVVPAGCGERAETVTHVDVPVRLEAVRKLHAPPQVTVTVEHKKDVPNASCGHSALCAVVLVAVVWKRVFPDEWDEATVVEGGQVVYEGRFDLKGALIEAVVRQQGQARLIGVVPLEKLDTRVVVEIARAPLRPDGTVGDFTPTPLLTQVDLRAAYRTKLAGERKPRARADLLIELGHTLREEALPLFTEWLPQESDEAAARATEGLCDRAEQKGAGPVVCARVLAIVSPAPGPQTALAGLRATAAAPYGESPGFPAQAPPFARAVVQHACVARSQAVVFREAFDAVRLAEAAQALGASSVRGSESPEVRAEVDKCPSPERRCLFRLTLGLRPSEDELRAALRSDLRLEVVARLDLSDPMYQRLLQEVMSAAEYQALLDQRVLSRLTSLDMPTPADLEALARIYASSGSYDDRQQINILYYLHKGNAKHAGEPFGVASPDPALARSRALVEAALAAQPGDGSPRLQAALLVLGDRQRAVPAARGLHMPTYADGLQRKYTQASLAQAKVIREALMLAGCNDEEIRQATEQAPGFSDGMRGELCTRPFPPPRVRHHPRPPSR